VSPFVSRLVVAAVLLPVVLGIVWLGGWWLFGLATVGGLLALHELFTMARSLRPVVLGGYVGVLLTLLGAQLGGSTWVLPGILATVPAALLVFFISSARQHAVAGFAVTVLGVAWVGGGIAYLMLLRDILSDGRLLIFVTLLTVFADDTAAFFVGRAIGRQARSWRQGLRAAARGPRGRARQGGLAPLGRPCGVHRASRPHLS
jgi:phosphatidate cytidylyltransferase